MSISFKKMSINIKVNFNSYLVIMFDTVPKLIAGYLFDVNVVWRKSREEIKKLQDRRLRWVLKYAYSHVPIYHEKYKKIGIYPDDISGINDIKKLPVITKDDIRENFPDGIRPRNVLPSKLQTLSTSGSTGKPITIYIDNSLIIKSIIAYIRILEAYGKKWNNTRITIIADTEYGTAGYTTFKSSLSSLLMKILHVDNIQILSISENPREMIRKIDEFNPDFLNGYPGILQVLSTLKIEEDLGMNISPDYISSSGAILDPYTRRYIMDAFGAHVFDIYESTEGGPMAFECMKGCYHIHSDMVHLEILDEEMNQVAPGEVGRIAVTKLYGKGTPVIRYIGMGDLARSIEDICSCNIHTDCIGSIEGRKVDSIVTPDGNIIPPLSITGIPNDVMGEENYYCIRQFQVVQRDKNEMLILIVPKGDIDRKRTERIYSKIKNRLQNKVGKYMTVRIEEVNKIPDYGNVLPPLVVSRIKKSL